MRKNLFFLLKKDVLLAGNYIFFAGAVMFGLPIIFGANAQLNISGQYLLFLTISFVNYFLFSNIFSNESKYKGTMHLVALPYTRFGLVVSKYLLLLCSTAVTIFTYILLSCINIVVFKKMDISAVCLSVFLIIFVYSIFFTLYFKFDYEKIKMLFLVITIYLPTMGIPLLSYFLKDIAVFAGKNTNLSEASLLSVVILTVVILLLSIWLSYRIYRKRNF